MPQIPSQRIRHGLGLHRGRGSPLALTRFLCRLGYPSHWPTTADLLLDPILAGCSLCSPGGFGAPCNSAPAGFWLSPCPASPSSCLASLHTPISTGEAPGRMPWVWGFLRFWRDYKKGPLSHAVACFPSLFVTPCLLFLSFPGPSRDTPVVQIIPFATVDRLVISRHISPL